MTFTESTIEQAAIKWLKDLGYNDAFGPELAFDGEAPERRDYHETMLLGRLKMQLPLSTRHFLSQRRKMHSGKSCA